jgi:ATP-dependent RNA helicase DDX46/PRP5
LTGFLLKVKAGTAQVGSGFGGKGLDRFDKDREATRKAERATFGEAEEPADKEEEEEEEESKAKDGASKAPVAMDVEIHRGAAPEFMRKGIVVGGEKPTGFDAMPIKMCALTLRSNQR